MIMPPLDAAPDRGPNHQRRRVLPARSVAHLGQLVHDLIVGRIDEVGELDLGDRPHAIERHTDGASDDPRLGQRRVDATLGAELLEEAGGGAKHAAEATDVFPEHDHPRVPSHFRP